MLIFGHPLIPSPMLYHVECIEAIAQTPSQAAVVFEMNACNHDIIAHCRANELPFALFVASVKEALFAERLDARYILTDDVLAKSVQKVAEAYLFDAKILARITDESQIEVIAFEGIDGVIFPEAIVKVTA